jgi:hypothetical protein
LEQNIAKKYNMFIKRGLENNEVFTKKNTKEELVMSTLSLRISTDKS